MKGFRGGEGRAVAIYSWKGRQVPGKRLYISPQLSSQFEKSGWGGLWINKVYIGDVDPSASMNLKLISATIDAILVQESVNVKIE